MPNPELPPKSDHDADRRSGEKTDWQTFYQRLDDGDSIAMRQLFDQYAEQLVRLAGENIHPALVKRFDGEDVVQSVFRSFFRRQQEGKLRIEHSQQLWKLLVTITLCKTRSQARRHTAKRRDVQEELGPLSDLQFPDRRASHEDVIALWEEIDVSMQGLPDRAAEIVSCRLTGKGKTEIAQELNLSRQTIHRILNLVEERLARRFEQISTSDRSI